MKRLYGELKLSWLKVILFAVAAGIYTAVVMMLPFLEGTSFQDIGVTFEWWVIFAVIIVVNCDKWWDAMLKCFVFFLISQPLVFLVQIVFGRMTLDEGLMYYNRWLIPSLLTLPGGLIAYFCKKQNVWGAIVLGLGNTIQAVMAVYYFGSMVNHFPHHLLTCLVCVGSIVVMSLFIQKKKSLQLLAMLLPVGLTAVILLLAQVTGRTLF